MDLFIFRNEQPHGPFSVEEVQQLRSSGELQDTDWIWYEGVTDWVPLSQVPGLSTPMAASPESPASQTASPVAPAPNNTPLMVKRLATAFVLFVVGFVILFMVIFVVAMGAQTSISAHAYSILEIDALVSLMLSAILSLWIAFSGVIPWCRASRPAA